MGYGMDEADLKALCAESPVHRWLALDIEKAPRGVALHTQLDDRLAQAETGQTAHGGIVATLLDTAATFALIAESGHDWTTVDLRIDYLRPTPLHRVTVVGEVVRLGRRIGRASSSLTDQNGKLCAVAIGTFVPVEES
jgi:uncharacterized protein (TIGR00369 family)